MNNVVTSLNKYGNKTFEEMPFNEVDAVLIGDLSYLNFNAYQKPICLKDLSKDYFEKRGLEFVRSDQDEAVLMAMGNSKRYQDVVLYKPVWKENDISFSCLTLLLPDQTINISYRGLLSGMNDWYHAFMISCGETEEQKEAVRYLDQIQSDLYGSIRLIGHSFGANLSMHAYMHANDPSRISSIYSIDGVGVFTSFQEQDSYVQALKILHRISPEFSVIGRLFESDVEPLIVASVASDFNQHAPLTWITDGYAFVTKDHYDPSGRQWTWILNEWVTKSDIEERRTFIQQFFGAMKSKGIKYFDQFLNAKGREKAEIRDAIMHTDWTTQKQFLFLMILIVENAMPKSAKFIRGWIDRFNQKQDFINGLLEYYKQK